MKVYIVTWARSGTHVDKVFLKKEDAELYCEIKRSNPDNLANWYCGEFDVLEEISLKPISTYELAVKGYKLEE